MFMVKIMSEYSNNYEKSFYKRLIVYIPKNDEKVIEKLNHVKSVSGYIKDLIKKDIEDEKKRAAK